MLVLLATDMHRTFSLSLLLHETQTIYARDREEGDQDEEIAPVLRVMALHQQVFEQQGSPTVV